MDHIHVERRSILLDNPVVPDHHGGTPVQLSVCGHGAISVDCQLHLGHTQRPPLAQIVDSDLRGVCAGAHHFRVLFDSNVRFALRPDHRTLRSERQSRLRGRHANSHVYVRHRRLSVAGRHAGEETMGDIGQLERRGSGVRDGHRAVSIRVPVLGERRRRGTIPEKRTGRFDTHAPHVLRLRQKRTTQRHRVRGSELGQAQPADRRRTRAKNERSRRGRPGLCQGTAVWRAIPGKTGVTLELDSLGATTADRIATAFRRCYVGRHQRAPTPDGVQRDRTGKDKRVC